MISFSLAGYESAVYADLGYAVTLLKSVYPPSAGLEGRLYSPFICFSACACTIEPEIGTPSALACTGVAQNQVVCLQRVFLISPASSSKSWTRLRSHCLECRDTTSPLGNDVDAKLWCINVSTTSSAGKYCLLLILLFIDKRLVNFSLSLFI